MTYELAGPKEALRDVRIAFSNVLYEIQEEGIDFSEEVLDQKLEKYVQDFVEIFEKNKAEID